MDAKELLSQRLAEALRARGMNPNQLAELLSKEGPRVYASVVANWLKGAVPGGEHLMRLPKALGINGHWLLTGEGDMVATPTDAENQLAQIRQLLHMPASMFRALPEEDKGQAAGTSG